MKSCKKLIALVLAVLMSFSILVCAAGAEGTVEASPSVVQSYVYPTIETEPDPDMISTIYSEYTSELSGIGEGVSEISGVFSTILKMFSDMFDKIYKALQTISDLFYSKAK
ncbi:MAG: hypothetical protein NC122_03485 [Faecalibacterium sp.]|nr:hypothetical protein [Ruminococcus sp.]MCM1391438.1 hypothetical protein [Ruminococcus sp.]MCM1485247.1 hypothetical protein [Faecalibacterium sp.]